jgi:hypothetical protein
VKLSKSQFIRMSRASQNFVLRISGSVPSLGAFFFNDCSGISVFVIDSGNASSTDLKDWW